MIDAVTEQKVMELVNRAIAVNQKILKKEFNKDASGITFKIEMQGGGHIDGICQLNEKRVVIGSAKIGNINMGNNVFQF